MGQRQQKAFVLLSLILLLLTVLPAVLHRNSRAPRADAGEASAATFQQEAAAYSDSLRHMQAREDSARHARYTHHNYRRNYQKANGDNATALAYRTYNGETPTAERQATAANSRPHYAARKRLTFELNSADTLDLQQLRGIGPCFARRIVNYRTALGGFVSKTQLQEVYGLPPETYRSIAPYLTLDASQVKKLNPNTATLNELKRHPYIDYYQARAIVDYRKNGHTYHNASDLLLVHLMTDSIVQRLTPYLIFS